MPSELGMSAESGAVVAGRSRRRLNTKKLGAGVVTLSAAGVVGAVAPPVALAHCGGGSKYRSEYVCSSLPPRFVADGSHNGYVSNSNNIVFPFDRVGCVWWYIEGQGFTSHRCANANGRASYYKSPPEHRTKSAYCSNQGSKYSNLMICRMSWKSEH
jgi:hypothetical protein